MTIDTSWYLDINGFARATPVLHSIVAGYALWGGLTVLVLLLVAGWLSGRRQPDATSRVALAALTGVAAAVALAANQVLSPAIARPRPCLALPRVEVLLPCSADFSMPSDHTMIAGALVAGLWVLDRKLGITAGVLAVALAVGRVYVGVHYPLDTLVGLLVGAAVAVVIILALRGPATTLAIRLADTPVGWLVSRGAPTPRHTAVTGSGPGSGSGSGL